MIRADPESSLERGGTDVHVSLKVMLEYGANLPRAHGLIGESKRAVLAHLLVDGHDRYETERGYERDVHDIFEPVLRSHDHDLPEEQATAWDRNRGQGRTREQVFEPFAHGEFNRAPGIRMDAPRQRW